MMEKTISLFTACTFLLGLVFQTAAQDVQFGYVVPSVVLTTADGRIRGARNRLDKDFVLGGLFPIHADVVGSGGSECGEVRLERGLERMEAMLYALDRINSDPNLLSNFTLGYDIRDTCNSENIGLDESIDLIITGSQLDINSCQSGLSTGVNGTQTEEVSASVPTEGIVGAASSRVSVPVASLVRLFDTPQISYASSSAILSNRDRYEFFYRTIPPDNLQARAMIDLILNFNWTYVSTIYSRNPYGEPGIVEFRNLAEQNGICIDLNEGIEDTYGEDEFATLAGRLIESEANVVIVFAAQDEAAQLLGNIANSTDSTDRFIWIASDAWARSINVVHKFNITASGLYGIAPLTEHLDKFHSYFSRLTINDNVRNPWFPEFYSAFVDCNLNETGSNRCNRDVNITSQPQYQQGNFVPLVIDSVYAYAKALDYFLNENCNQPIVWYRSNRTCAGQRRELNGSALLEYISRVDFISPTGNRILFDNEGNVEGKYEILNYQARKEANNRLEFFFQRVGTWDSSIINDSNVDPLKMIDDVPVQFGVDSETLEIANVPPDSQCGRCEPGQYRRLVQSSCCGICDPCLGQNFSDNPVATDCIVCPDEMWGNDPLVGSRRCVPVNEEFLDFTDAWSIIIIILALFGLINVIATTVIYGIFWKTPIVKSSGREQMLLLLVGIGLSFAVSIIYVSPPVIGICAIQRIGLWFCFSLMFGALLIKIVRVARIFLSKASLKKPRFMEPYYQVLFTFGIVLIQMLIVGASLAYQHPEVIRTLRLNTNMPNDFPTVVITCVGDPLVFLILSIAFLTIIIIASTVLGVLSFKYPENFNEAKYVSFCTFALLVIWIGFFTTYFATQTRQEYQNAAISLAVLMSAYAMLVCLFAHKLLIILFRPEKNLSSYSHPRVPTTTDIPMGTLQLGMQASTHFSTIDSTGMWLSCIMRKHMFTIKIFG